MKIAMLGTRGLPATHGGVERAVEELSVRLAAAGHEVTIYCRPAYCPDRLPSYRGVNLRYLPAVRTKHLEAASHSFLAACAAAAGGFDVVHIHSIGPALFSLIPRLAGRKVVVTVHALDYKRRKWGSVAKAALRAGVWSAARLSHATITVSRQVQRHLEERFRRKPAYIPNGVAVPASLGAPAPAAKQLLFLGRLVPEKRVDDLIAAFRRTEGDHTLVIAGGGSFSERHVQELGRLALGDSRIRFAGEVYGEAKERLFLQSWALVNPSDLEGHPIVVLEAMAHGLPVLLSDIPEHREILEADGAPREAGLLFRTGDRIDLLRGIDHLAAFGVDESSCEARRRFVRTVFDWDSIAASTYALYEELTTGVSRSAEEGAAC